MGSPGGPKALFALTEGERAKDRFPLWHQIPFQHFQQVI